MKHEINIDAAAGACLLYTSEELHWSAGDVTWAKPGMLMTNCPHTYKIPAASDVPTRAKIK